MRILFVIGPLKKGGAERVICNLSNELIKNNEVFIATTITDKSDYKLDERIKVICTDSENCNNNFFIKNMNRIKNLKRIIKHYNIDLAISFLPEPSYRLMLIKNKKLKTIVSDRNDPNVEYNNFVKKIITKILYNKSNGFVFQTPDAMNYFSKKIQKRSVIIPNPINDRFIKEKPFSGKRNNNIVSVGRLTSQKNQKLLIDAFNIVHRENPDFNLCIYGEGELENALRTQISDLKLENCVLLKGNSDVLDKELYNSKMFVLSSDYEGMPNALMEAMALGVPCISTDCPIGGPKFLMKNQSGLLVPIKDKEKLAKAINQLIEDEVLAKKISINALNETKKYTNSKINKMWVEFIDLIIKT